MIAGLFVLLVLQGALASPPLQLKQFAGLEDELVSFKLFDGVRLPQDVYPIHYDVQIRPIVNLAVTDPEQFTAPGEVTIRLRCDVQTSSITLHSNDIVIQHDLVTVRYAATGIYLRVISHSNDSSISTYTINLESTLDPNIEYLLNIPFVSNVGNRLSGLYRSSYVDANGNTRWLATTQFQTLGARMAFPCFDEPNFKSTYNITIGRPEGYNSLSNGALFATTGIPGLPGWYWDYHETTVRMSSYLIAIIVSDFVSVDAPQELSRYDVKVWGPPTITDNTSAAFSSESAAQIVTYFENYLESEYQFPKLDSAAIPDFAAGAMENWALNTYRISYLITFDGETTQMEKWFQALVIGHEISHHWFGDLVTCEWWNDLWLNEGFASYMELVGANSTGVNFGAIDRYPLDKFQLAMDFDVLAGSRPVHSNVTDQVDIPPTRIIYQKGASLIRTMQGFLSERTLIGGIRNYLDRYAYGNTVQDQLFADLQTQAEADGTAAPFTVKEIMDTWTLQTGFPIVRLSYVGTGDVVTITQERYAPSQAQRETQQSQLWYVPVAYASRSNPDFSESNWGPQFWLESDTASVTRLLPNASSEWIILNPDARSYFRVVYDSHFFPPIVDQLNENHEVIGQGSRCQMFDDYFKSAFAGYVRIQDALDLTTYLENELANSVWTTVSNNLRPIRTRLQDSEYYSDFSTYILSKVIPPLNQLGWEQNDTSDAPVDIILRSILLDWACALNAPQCANLSESYAVALAGGSRIPPDVQPMVFCKAVSIQDSINLPGEFSVKGYLLEQYLRATRVERQPIFINALACDALQYVESWLELAISPTSPVSVAHSIQLIQRLSENPDNRAAVLNFLSQNLNATISRLGQASIANIVSSMAAYTAGSEPAIAISDFVYETLEVITQENVRQSLTNSLNQLVSNIIWLGQWGSQIRDWLNQQNVNV